VHGSPQSEIAYVTQVDVHDDVQHVESKNKHTQSVMSSCDRSHPSVSAEPDSHTECEHDPRSSVHEPVVVWQTPIVHVPLHGTPQPPQFALSLPIVSTQLLLQQLSEPHGVPQPPQLFGSLVVSTH
jgi:hypothetical protein